MSADAKIWCDEERGGWVGWQGLHDAPDNETCWKHTQGGSLMQTLAAVEKCMGKELRWETRTYPGDKIGLVGYVG